MEKRLESFFRNHNITPAYQNSRSFVFDCPACGGSKKLYISRDSGLSICFKGKTDKCPRSGSQAPYALSLLSRLPIETVKTELFEFISHLADDIRVDFTSNKSSIKESNLEPGTLPPDVILMGNIGSEEGSKYLENRGVPIDIQKQYEIMFSPNMRRVIFPIIMDKKLYGWQGRAIDSVDKKYRMYNMVGDWKSKTLMFYNNIIDKEFAIIAEGPVSALKFYKIGNFVATMGKEISKKQLELILSSGVKKVYLALDRDAVDKIDRIRYYLNSNGIECYFIETPHNRDDFGDSTFEECELAFKTAKLLNGNEIFAHIEVKLEQK